jgi:hypothetical protein
MALPEVPIRHPEVPVVVPIPEGLSTLEIYRFPLPADPPFPATNRLPSAEEARLQPWFPALPRDVQVTPESPETKTAPSLAMAASFVPSLEDATVSQFLAVPRAVQVAPESVEV